MDFALESERRSIVSFITNYAFIGARTYDGFRKDVRENFKTAYVINLKGDARTSGVLRQANGGNIFNDAIRVGIGISMFIPKQNKRRNSCPL
jgi:predicted helicase